MHVRRTDPLPMVGAKHTYLMLGRLLTGSFKLDECEKRVDGSCLKAKTSFAFAFSGTSFNCDPVKNDFGHLSSICDCVSADGIVSEVVCAVSFGHAGITVCRVHGRLRGRDMPAAG